MVCIICVVIRCGTGTMHVSAFNPGEFAALDWSVAG